MIHIQQTRVTGANGQRQRGKGQARSAGLNSVTDHSLPFSLQVPKTAAEGLLEEDPNPPKPQAPPSPSLEAPPQLQGKPHLAHGRDSPDSPPLRFRKSLQDQLDPELLPELPGAAMARGAAGLHGSSSFGGFADVSDPVLGAAGTWGGHEEEDAMATWLQGLHEHEFIAPAAFESQGPPGFGAAPYK